VRRVSQLGRDPVGKIRREDLPERFGMSHGTASSSVKNRSSNPCRRRDFERPLATRVGQAHAVVWDIRIHDLERVQPARSIQL
jgi:hypothetical protein